MTLRIPMLMYVHRISSKKISPGEYGIAARTTTRISERKPTKAIDAPKMWPLTSSIINAEKGTLNFRKSIVGPAGEGALASR
jgi:hypothetical protein